jgi:sugar fermentation stimulation protein A
MRMLFPSRLIRGILVQRYKRFLADVRLPSGEIVTAHCTNTGSMLGCKEPGSMVYLSLSPNKGRKLAYTWEMIQIKHTWIGINTLHPNRLVAEAIEAGGIPELRGYEAVRREVKVGAHSRLDLCLEGRSGCCYVEVKNVTVSFHGVAAFPDAVSERATKHLKELIRLKRKGHRAAILFVIQRGDCEYFRPADEIDPEYGRWLRKAAKAGVEILPYVAKVTPRGILLADKLETRLELLSLPRAQRT